MSEMEPEHGYLALPQAETGPAVILLHAWWGLNDYFIALANRLASEGFVVYAPDLYNGEIASTIDEAEALNGMYENDEGVDAIVAKLDATVDALKAHPAVSSTDLGVVGFSMGANWGLWLAHHRPDAIGAMVAFYGTYGGNLEGMRAAFQGHYAENDPFAPREEVEAFDKTLSEMNLEATFYVYEGTGHWFFEADRPEYHAESARLAWEWMVNFLHEKL